MAEVTTFQGLSGENDEKIQKVSKRNPLPVEQGFSKTAFGDLAVSSLSPEVQIQFPYAINTEIIKVKDNKGSTTVENHMVKLSTGAAANQVAELNSVVPLKYHPGQGALVRFTALFTPGVVGSVQVAGIGNTADGLFFGYNGADFGILRKQGGAQEVQILTITVASSTAENVTITLDGDTKVDVAVTASANIFTTANEIAAADYSDIGRGWEAHSPGDGTVFFKSYCSLVHPGAFTLSSATTAVGTFSQTLAGVVPTNNWVNQEDWNGDKADNSANLPALDTTKGNVYQIKYQWLGYGAISFYIEHAEEGDFHLVHRIKYANTVEIPSLDNPTLPLCLLAKNTSNTSDIIVRSSSMGAYTEGKIGGGHIHHGKFIEYSGIGTTETPILTIHNKLIYQGKENRVRMKIIVVSLSAEGTKPSTMRLVFNGILTGASYTDINTLNSVADWDFLATAISGGTEQFATGLAKSGADKLELGEDTFYLNPGEFMTITGKAIAGGGPIEGTVSANWEELF